MNSEHAMRSATIELTAFERDAASSSRSRPTAIGWLPKPWPLARPPAPHEDVGHLQRFASDRSGNVSCTSAAWRVTVSCVPDDSEVSDGLRRAVDAKDGLMCRSQTGSLLLPRRVESGGTWKLLLAVEAKTIYRR